MKSANNISKIILYIVLAVVVIAVIAGAAYYLTPGAAKAKYTATPVTRMDITQTVTATGAAAPDQQSVLAFDGNGGTIASVNVAVGDHVTKGQVLATLQSDILQSGLQGAQADLAAAQAQLSTLEQGAKPADVAVYSQKVADAQTSLSSAIHDAYLKTEDAIENQTDAFFNNAVSSNPIINVPTQNTITQVTIDNERVLVGSDLTNWQNALSSDTPNSVTNGAETQASTTLADARQFLTDLGNIMNNLNTSNSGFSQTAIAADRTVVTNAATEVTAALTEYTGAISAVNESQSSLTLEQSSAAPTDIQGQQAEVAKAQAEISADQSQIDQTELVAPFNGIVTDVEPTVGEVFSAGVPAITVISGGPLKINVQVSETDVAKLGVGDMANVTLSAYGSGVIFPASITTIAPAETTVNNVTGYAVTLHFTSLDSRILAGMTANVSVVTASSTNVLAVPAGDVITDGAQTFILVQSGNKGQYVEKPITTGISGSNGYVEVTSGLNDGDVVASF